MPDAFYNPYTFVPPMDPPAGKYDAKKPSENMLHQGPPAGHDCYHEGLWSGRIGIEIETVTPLLVPEAGPVSDVNGHKTFQTQRRGTTQIGGKDVPVPNLPVTSLKGPLRAAYEAVTNSRFGVFRGHHAPHARRMEAGKALQLIPGRIVKAAKGDGLEVELLMGTTVGYPEWDAKKKQWRIPDKITKKKNGKQENERQPSYAAWLPTSRRTNNLALPDDVKNGDAVAIRLQLVDRRPVAFWEVVRLTVRPSQQLAAAGSAVASTGYFPDVSKFHPNATGAQNGYVCWNNHNMEGKHDERVFFSAKSPPNRLEITENVKKRWQELILNYKSVFKRDGWNHKGTVPSRHIDAPGTELLAFGTLCYVKLLRCIDDPNRHQEDGKKNRIVEALYPVMISRELGLVSPYDMLNEMLRAALTLEELSPADRVFGWVRDETANKTSEASGSAGEAGIGAWKGQLRIAPIKFKDCIGAIGTPMPPIETFGPTAPPLPLSILSTPKPSQARFYAAKDKKGAPLATGADRGQTAYFDPLKSNTNCGLRGRKIYPHHALVTGNAAYWTASAAIDEGYRNNHYDQVPTGNGSVYREYVRHRGTKQKGDPIDNQDDQNRSIKDWIRPRTTFTTHIDVVNLNPAELGALLWLLDLAKSATGPRAAHLRVGGGKPLGFGSVTIKIISLELADGGAKKRKYSALQSVGEDAAEAADRTAIVARDATTVEAALAAEPSLIQKFRDSLKGADPAADFNNIPFIAAFLAAARGHTEHPVHYPRVGQRPNPAGENFKWFGSNEHQDGPRRPLPTATDTTGLPYFE
jgi:CRISPR-associated protein (TIGR03986 family)